MEHYVIYRFFAADNEKIEVRLDFDAITLELLPVNGQPAPDWARLDARSCPDCTLAAGSLFCPVALGVARFLGAFDSRFSYEKAVVEIETRQCVILSKGSFQAGMASLLAVIAATSGCPSLRFLRPAIRLYLPFFDGREALSRFVSTSLLLDLAHDGRQAASRPTWRDDATQRYATLRGVMSDLADRVRPVVRRHASVNADAVLAAFAAVASIECDEETASPGSVHAPL